MIIVNISMNPAEYGQAVTHSQAAKIARAINKAVQNQFKLVFTVFKLEPSSVIANDSEDTEEMIHEVKSWLANNQARLVSETLT